MTINGRSHCFFVILLYNFSRLKVEILYRIDLKIYTHLAQSLIYVAIFLFVYENKFAARVYSTATKRHILFDTRVLSFFYWLHCWDCIN
jgi:hypothetical protein